jgi:methionine-rich copper-binding protein CopC
VAFAPSTRRVLAALAATTLLATGLALLSGPASAEVARLSETPTAGSTVGPDLQTVSATYQNFLLAETSITVTGPDGPVCSGVVGVQFQQQTVQCTVSRALVSGDYLARITGSNTDIPTVPISDSFTFTVDADSPQPTTQITPDPVNSAATSITVSGTTTESATATATITLSTSESDAASKTVPIREDGTYTVTFDPEALADGVLTASTVVTDAYGNTSEPGTDTAAKDTVAPQRTGNSPASGATQSPPAEVEVFYDERLDTATSTVTVRMAGEPVAGTVRFENDDRHIVFDPDATLPDGTYDVTADVADLAGNRATHSFSFTVSSAERAAPSIDAPDYVNAQTDESYVVRGTVSAAERGNSVRVRVTDEKGTAQEQLVSSHLTTGEYDAAFGVSTMADGTLVATARVLAADTTAEGPQASTTSVKDTAAPAAPVVDLPAVCAADADAVPVRGSGEPAATATVTVDDEAQPATAPVTFTVVVDEDGSFTRTLDLSSLQDGTLTATATQTDRAGNESGEGSDSAPKDTEAPTLVAAAPGTGSTVAPPDRVSFTFDEQLSDSHTVRLVGPDGPAAGTVSQSSDSRTVTITPESPLSDGQYDARAEVEDLVGNPGSGATSFTVQSVQSSASPSASASVSASASPTTGTGGGDTGGTGGGGGGGGEVGVIGSPSPSAGASTSPVASASPTSPASPSASPSSVASRDGAGYVGLPSPVRVLDSRNGTGTPRQLKRGAVVLDLSERVPAGATAAVLNVTVTNPTANGFVVVYPDGNAKPGTSNVNVVRNQTQANEVVVGLPASRRVVVFVDSASAHVIADLIGFFTEADRADLGRVITQAPSRVLDSREGLGTSTGRKRGEVVLDLSGTIPAGTTSVALNVTVTGPDARGFVVVYPTGTARPGTSNVNVERGQTQANEVVTRLGTGANAGKVSLFVDSASAAVIADLVATVVPRDGSGSQLFTALQQPQRVMDTRIAQGAGAGRKNGEVVLTLPAGVVPAGATGAVLNVTTTGASRSGFVAVHPTGTANPGTSNVNFRVGVNQANEVLTAINGSRQVTLLVGGSGTPVTHLVVDVVGYLTSTG